MNAEELKEYIKEDIDKIKKILEEIGCHSIWQARGEIRCATPSGDNHTSVAVNIDTLSSRVYSNGETVKTDILGLVQHFRKEKFIESMRFIKALFGIGGVSTKKKRDPLANFKSIRSQNRTTVDINELDVPKFGIEKLYDFDMVSHINLFYEGIMPQTSQFFKVGYDPKQDRIIFPHFNYDDTNAIVGITGRTLRSKAEMKAFQIPKYWNYIKGYMKMYNLYGFSHSLPYVISNHKLVIFEAEKSVLKHHTIHRNEGFSSSVGGHELSDAQVQIILYYTPVDTEIIIAFDKDVMTMKNDDGEAIGEQFLIDTCNKISKYRKTSYIWDTYNILGENDSPIDKGVKIWRHLFKYRKEVGQ
ncbi:hypothetical protein RVS70_05240 [Virgibacillus sp. M23]|uniref:hypothetical protein n=1 Tax=Virgibacillus sp. M23 TaxID=3079030 RepID=UPI002A9142BF|nr:hypothetical protein [Virgibacillus sp. M23]MDY7043605.1 hypothetical protein [Virgibacillus sp. M23]